MVLMMRKWEMKLIQMVIMATGIRMEITVCLKAMLEMTTCA